MPSARPESHRRGRPQKYGRPSQVVACTLPREVVRQLRRIHSDLGWAIVSLVEKAEPQRSHRAIAPDAELVEVGQGTFLIVVNSHVLRSIPGVQLVPLSDSQAFLALDPPRGLADLEVAVGDAVTQRATPVRSQQALRRLLAQLRRWRRTSGLISQTRTIILLAKSPRS